LHLWLGLGAGLVVLVVALTGSIMVFQDELEPVLFSKTLKVEPGREKLPLDSLLKLAKQEFPKKKINQAKIFYDKSRSLIVTFGKKEEDADMKMVFIDPYTGRVLGKGDYNHQFFLVVKNLHRYLLAGETGKIITGLSCCIFIVLLISGMVLWWPVNKNAIKQRLRIKWKASAKRLNWDLHAVTGFYSSFFLLIISCTGLVWSYQWANNLIFQLADGKGPEKKKKVMNYTAVSGGRIKNVYETALLTTDSLYAFHGNTTITPPAGDSTAIAIVKDNITVAGEPPYLAWFDSKTGRYINHIPFTQYTTGLKIRKMILPIHTGSIYGWPTKLLALAVSLFAAALPVTGCILWLGKKRKKV